MSRSDPTARAPWAGCRIISKKKESPPPRSAWSGSTPKRSGRPGRCGFPLTWAGPWALRAIRSSRKRSFWPPCGSWRNLRGPAILKEFGEDEPPCPAGTGPLACPVSFSREEKADPKSLEERFRQEVAGLATWYRAAREKHGKTMADTAGLGIEEAVEFLLEFAQGKLPENPRPGFDLGLVLKAVGEDIKAYYFEAVTAQPGGTRSHRELRAWFWRETAAAEVFKKIKGFCDASDDKTLKLMGGFCLVPRVQD